MSTVNFLSTVKKEILTLNPNKQILFKVFMRLLHHSSVCTVRYMYVPWRLGPVFLSRHPSDWFYQSLHDVPYTTMRRIKELEKNRHIWMIGFSRQCLWKVSKHDSDKQLVLERMTVTIVILKLHYDFYQMTCKIIIPCLAGWSPLVLRLLVCLLLRLGLYNQNQQLHVLHCPLSSSLLLL